VSSTVYQNNVLSHARRQGIVRALAAPTIPAVLPFAEASLRPGYVTYTTDDIPVGVQNFTLPNDGNDALLDMGWVQRDRMLLVYVRPGQRVHVKNLYVVCNIAATSGNSYSRSGLGFQPVSPTSGTADHISASNILITGPTLNDGFVFGHSGATQPLANRVTYQNFRVESASLYRGAKVTDEPSGAHADAYHMQGPGDIVEFGLGTFYALDANYPGKCVMINAWRNGSPDSDTYFNKVNFRDGGPTGTNNGSHVFQEARADRVHFTDCYGLVESSSPSYQWATGSSLYLAYQFSGATWTSSGTAPNRVASFAGGTGFNGQVLEGKSPSGLDYVTRESLGLGKLKWQPPGWNGQDPRKSTSFPGYTVVNITGPGVYNLSSGTDYFLKIQDGGVSWSNSNARDSVNIVGGRNRVIVGGSIIGTSTATTSDHVALLIDDGDASGITHLEGLYLESVNGITLRTKQTVQIEYCHVVTRAYQNDHSTAHPDLIQIWDRGPCTIRQDWFTGYSAYTGLTCLLAPDPLSWERNNTNVRPWIIPGDSQGTVSTYHTAGPVGQAGGPYCTYTSNRLWIQPGNYNASTVRKLDDVLVLKHLSGGLNLFPYDIYSPADALLYASPSVPTGGNSPVNVGAGYGNYLVVRQAEYLGQRWYYGTPPQSQGADANGDFVPAAKVGNNYVPVGYTI